MASQENLQIQCRKLTDKYTTQSLCVFSELVATAMGPHGRIKLLGNVCGGHLSLTTLSTRLLNTLTPTCPLVKLILTAADQQVCSYGDAGLFTARLALNLVVNGIHTQMNPKLLRESNSALFGLLSDYLHSVDCPCKILADITDVKSWICVAHTMLSAKPLCELEPEEANLIAQLLLEAFVVKLPTADPEQKNLHTMDDVHIIGVPGQSSDQSFCCQGLLLEVNNLPEVEDWLNKHYSHDNLTSAVKTIVVNISMAGDSEEFLGVTFEGSSLESLEETFLAYVEEFCQQLVMLDIRIVFCQKVIHPRIKELLRGKHILSVDRLGSEYCPRVLSVTGASPVSSFSTSVTADQVGSVDHLSIMNVNRKSFLHMKRASATMATLVLSAYLEEQLEELKAICNNVLIVFDHLLRNPSVLFGGGCWQFNVTNYLRTKVKIDSECLSKELQCSFHQLLEACEYFCRCLEQSSLPEASSGMKCYTHTSLGHLWAVDKQLADVQTQSVSCMCGVTKCQLSNLNPLPEEYFSFAYGMQNLPKDNNAALGLNSTLSKDSLEKPSLMDCFVSWRNALETSIRIADMTLGTNQFIFESVHSL